MHIIICRIIIKRIEECLTCEERRKWDDKKKILIATKKSQKKRPRGTQQMGKRKLVDINPIY